MNFFNATPIQFVAKAFSANSKPPPTPDIKPQTSPLSSPPQHLSRNHQLLNFAGSLTNGAKL